METKRDLAYWKQRQVDLRNCVAAAHPRSSYWAELWRAYRYAETKVRTIEARILVNRAGYRL